MTGRTRRRWSSLVAWLLLGLGVAASWPVQLGGHAGYTVVVGTSMEPGLRTGDLLLTWRQQHYRPGDVVVYRVPRGQPGAGGRVVHRVVATEPGGGYVTRGDNRDQVDLWRPAAADILGRARGRLPAAGFALAYLRHPLLWAAATGLLVALLVATPTSARPARRSARAC